MPSQLVIFGFRGNVIGDCEATGSPLGTDENRSGRRAMHNATMAGHLAHGSWPPGVAAVWAYGSVVRVTPV